MTTQDFPFAVWVRMAVVVAIGVATWRSRGPEEALRNTLIASLTMSLGMIVTAGLL